jgi:hypothetical protein
MNFFSKNYSFPSGMGRKGGSISQKGGKEISGSMFCSRRKVLHFLVGAFFTPVFIPFLGIATVSKRNHHPASRTFGW